MAAITKDMGIMEVVGKWSETVDVFMKHGMGCLGCSAARYENIEQGASAHGIDVDALVADLNKVVEKDNGSCKDGCCGCN